MLQYRDLPKPLDLPTDIGLIAAIQRQRSIGLLGASCRHLSVRMQAYLLQYRDLLRPLGVHTDAGLIAVNIEIY